MAENPASELQSLHELLTECRERIATLSGENASPGEVEFLTRLANTLVVRVDALTAEREAFEPGPEPQPEPAPEPQQEREPAPAPEEDLEPLPIYQPAPGSVAAMMSQAAAERSGTAAERPAAPPSPGTPLVHRLQPGRTPSPPQPTGPSLNWEQWLGEKLFLKLALLLVVAGVAWAFKYAYDIGVWGALPPVVKVLCGLLTGGGLVAGGLIAERREAYTWWGRGVVAAGWPLIYFTAYAAHHFEASRIIHSPALGLTALCATAAAAIGFSLRYRNEVVTIAGYALGYLALLLSGAAPGVLIAGAVFTVSLAVLYSRFKWQWLGVTGLLGSAAVYLYYLQPSFSHAGWTFGRPPAAFWANVWFPTLTWAALAIAGHCTVREGRWALPAYLTVKNAFVYFACFALTPHVPDPANEYLFPLLLGGAHLALCIHARSSERRPLFVAESAVGVALLLLAAAIKLAGIWLTFAWIAQGAVLVLLGVWFVERPLRLSGYAALFLAAGRVLLIDAPHGGMSALGLMCAAGGLTISLLRARKWGVLSEPETHAPGAMACLALGSFVVLCYAELSLVNAAVAITLAGAAGAWIIRRDVVPAPAPPAQILTLSGLMGLAIALVPGLEPLNGVQQGCGALALAAGFAAAAAPEWHGRRRGHGWLVTGVAQLLALALIAHVWDGGDVAMGWALLGFGGLMLTAFLNRDGAKLDAGNFAAAAALALGTLRAVRIATLHWAVPIGGLEPLHLGIGAVIGVMLVAACVESSRGEHRAWQPYVFGGLAVTLITSLITQECSAGWLSFGWGVEGAVLLAIGFALGVAALRYTGVALLLFTAAKVLLWDTRHLETPFRVLSFIGLGLILLAVSWAYTRRRALFGREGETPAPPAPPAA